MTDELVWEVCEEITCKNDWYSKVFNDTIVQKWRDEISDTKIDAFDFAIKILRASAQGSKHFEDCDWVDTHSLCEDCENNLKQDIINNPDKYGIDLIDTITFEDGWEHEFEDIIECDHPECNCVGPDSSLHKYLDYYPDGIKTSP